MLGIFSDKCSWGFYTFKNILIENYSSLDMKIVFGKGWLLSNLPNRHSSCVWKRRLRLQPKNKTSSKKSVKKNMPLAPLITTKRCQLNHEKMNIWKPGIHWDLNWGPWDLKYGILLPKSSSQGGEKSKFDVKISALQINIFF